MSSACVCHTEVERLRGMYEDERALNGTIGIEREEQAKEMRKMRAIAELAVKALEHYADKKNHEWSDWGKLAKSTLEEIKRIYTEGVSQ